MVIKNNIWVFVSFLLLGIILYAKIMAAPFVFDDGVNITANPAVWAFNIGEIWQKNATRLIPYLSFTVNYLISGNNPVSYHWVNVLIHAGNAYLVYLIAYLIFNTKYPVKAATTASVCVGLIFLCHPLQTESVSYIVQRITSLSALFYLSTVYLYVQYLKTREVRYYAASIFVGFLTIFTKENVFVLPLALLLCERMFSSDGFKNQLKRAIPFLLLVLMIPVLLWFNIHNGRNLTSIISETNHVSSHDYFLTQLNVIREYIRLFYWPIHQNLDYDFPISTSLFEALTLLSFGLIGAVLSFGIWFRQKNKILAFGIGWFFIHLLVESSFIPIKDVILEHRMYLPSFGLCLITIELFQWLIANERIRMVALSVVIVVFCVATIKRNMVWQSSFALWQDTLNKSPHKARPYVNLAGEYIIEKKYPEALELLLKAQVIDSSYAVEHLNFAVVYEKTDDLDKALFHILKALELDPENIRYLTQAGYIYAKRHDSAAALPFYAKVMSLEPTDHNAGEYTKMIVAYYRSEKNKEQALKYGELLKEYGYSGYLDFLKNQIEKAN